VLGNGFAFDDRYCNRIVSFPMNRRLRHQQSLWLFNAIKLAAAVYLVWLGVMLAVARGS